MNEKVKGFILFKYVGQLFFRYKEDDIPSSSVQITYYMILSFFPFMIFLINLLSFTPLSSEMLITNFNTLIPNDTRTLVENIVVQTLKSKSGTLLFIGIIGTLWSYSKGMSAIMNGLNKAYDVDENRSFIKLNTIALASIVGVTLMIMLALILIVFGDFVGTYGHELIGESPLFNIISSSSRYTISIAVMFITFSLLYKYLPNIKLKYKSVLIGTIFTTVGWITTSLLFSFYVNNFANFQRVYGSLGGIIALIIWLNISTSIILIGGELNAIKYVSPKKESDKKHGKIDS